MCVVKLYMCVSAKKKKAVFKKEDDRKDRAKQLITKQPVQRGGRSSKRMDEVEDRSGQL